MTTQWINIKDQQPQDHQDVWYYFGVFDKVYQGKYVLNSDTWTDDENVEHTFHMNCFYGSGFLNDDVMFWMPYNEGDSTPERPDCLLLLQDYHIPDRLQIKMDAMTIGRMYQAVLEHGNAELIQQINEILTNPVLPPSFYTKSDD